jgi:hypothetical protein
MKLKYRIFVLFFSSNYFIYFKIEIEHNHREMQSLDVRLTSLTSVYIKNKFFDVYKYFLI